MSLLSTSDYDTVNTFGSEKGRKILKLLFVDNCRKQKERKKFARPLWQRSVRFLKQN